MIPYYSDNLVTLYHGDCREVLPSLSDVDHVLTDPPYGLKFMGKGWDKEVPGVEFWTAIAEACKPGAMMMAFGGTRTFHRLGCAIEDAGWEIRDTLCWLYGQGFPKSLDISKAIDKAAGAVRRIIGKRSNAYADSDCWGRPNSNSVGKSWGVGNGKPSTDQDGHGSTFVTAPSTAAARQWNGWGTVLKPAWDPIILAMKALDGTFAANGLAHGVAGLNVDGGRIGVTKDIPVRKHPPPRPTGYRGGWKRPCETDSGLNANIGRWPANVALDEDAAAMLDEQSGEQKDGNATLSTKGGMFTFGGRDHPFASYGGSGGASRFFYTAKASRSDRGGRFNTHATVKPTELLRWLLTLLATPTGGTCLDPFAGSGSTVVVCKALGRKCIGIELIERYCEIAAKRLQGETAGMFDMTGGGSKVEEFKGSRRQTPNPQPETLGKCVAC